MAKKATVKVTPKKITVYADGKAYERFVKKCKKAGTGVSARIRELIAQDLKV